MLRELSGISRILKFQFFTLKKLVKVVFCNFRNHSLADIQIFKVVPCIFALALTVSEMLTFKIVDVKK